MSTIKVVSMTGAEVGTVELNDAIFGVEPNMSVVHEVVKNHLANCRQGTQSALTRAEVSGGGRKPWRQKGTGRARQGSTRSPQWTHGGIAFAPKPRTYSYVLNKKVKRLALKSVLSSKAKDGEIVVIDKIAMDEIKTKSFKNFLTAVNAEGKSVVVTPEGNDIVVKSARNIPGVVTSPAKLINVYDLLNAKTLVIDKDALAVVDHVLHGLGGVALDLLLALHKLAVDQHLVAHAHPVVARDGRRLIAREACLHSGVGLQLLGDARVVHDLRAAGLVQIGDNALCLADLVGGQAAGIIERLDGINQILSDRLVLDSRNLATLRQDSLVAAELFNHTFLHRGRCNRLSIRYLHNFMRKIPPVRYKPPNINM